MKIFLEKVALPFTIIASLLSTLEYFGILFSKEIFTWMPSFVNTVLVWLYENIILLEVNIWVFLILVYLFFKSYNFYISKQKNSNDNPIDFYQKMDMHYKIIFNLIAKYHNSNRDCMMKNLQTEANAQKISNLELEEIVGELENNFFIEQHPSYMAPPRYKLTDIGRALAVELIKMKKTNK